MQSPITIPYPGLTPAQSAVLYEVATTGDVYTKIGTRLGLSERAIKTHMSDILRRLGLISAQQAILYAHLHQWVKRRDISLTTRKR